MTPSDRSSHPPDSNGPAPRRLACPRCRARYSPSKSTFGRRVRCRHCGHVWRDQAGAAGQIAGALGKAATQWAQLGSTILATTDHASTMGHIVADMAKVPQAAADQWIGRSLSRYDIKAVLGQGAMGFVYEAVDRELKRPVALKVLPRRIDPNREPVGLKLFLQEARVAARLQHPNVVTIYDVGQENGTYFFAMERVSGTTLFQLVAEHGPLPAHQACYVIAHAARALAAGHALGIVHRDVKPSNILLDIAGLVKVADFGLADVAGIEGIAELSKLPLGTPGWISPEVARGEQATPASDIYGLGLTLYHAMTGKRLIEAATKSGMVRKQREAKSISRDQLPPGWPPRLQDIVLQCLEAEPSNRYQSAELLAADLLQALAPDAHDATLNLPSGASPPFLSERTRVPPVVGWIALGLLALVTIALAVRFWLLR